MVSVEGVKERSVGQVKFKREENYYDRCSGECGHHSATEIVHMSWGSFCFRCTSQCRELAFYVENRVEFYALNTLV